MGYKKPKVRSYSGRDILEELGPCQNQYTTTFYTTTGNSNVNVDGVISSGTVVYTSYSIYIGDYTDSTYTRGFVGFDISSLEGKTIVPATLRAYQCYVAGAPYSDPGLGTVVADHVNFGSSLDYANDFDTGGAATLTNNIGTISTNSTLERKTSDVTNYVQADLNAGRTSSQYRLRFTNNTDGDGFTDRGYFESAENPFGTGNTPQLVVTYR